MAKHRPAPAYQEYAASLLSDRSYRLLSLSQRGLLHTLKLECWVNGSVPSDVCELSKIIGFPEDQIKTDLPGIQGWFQCDGFEMVCPELEDYRNHLELVRVARSKGGKASGESRAKVKNS